MLNKTNLQTPQAQALRKAMADAREALEKALTSYEHTLGFVLDKDASGDRLFALQCDGRSYAQALVLYSEATMAWLVYTDTQLRQALQSAPPIGVSSEALPPARPQRDGSSAGVYRSHSGANPGFENERGVRNPAALLPDRAQGEIDG